MKLQYKGTADERVVRRSDLEAAGVEGLDEDVDEYSWTRANHFTQEVPDSVAELLRRVERRDWAVQEEDEFVEPPPAEENEGDTPEGSTVEVATGAGLAPGESSEQAPDVPEAGLDKPSRKGRNR